MRIVSDAMRLLLSERVGRSRTRSPERKRKRNDSREEQSKRRKHNSSHSSHSSRDRRSRWEREERDSRKRVEREEKHAQEEERSRKRLRELDQGGELRHVGTVMVPTATVNPRDAFLARLQNEQPIGPVWGTVDPGADSWASDNEATGSKERSATESGKHISPVKRWCYQNEKGAGCKFGDNCKFLHSGTQEDAARAGAAEAAFEARMGKRVDLHHTAGTLMVVHEDDPNFRGNEYHVLLRCSERNGFPHYGWAKEQSRRPEEGKEEQAQSEANRALQMVQEAMGPVQASALMAQDATALDMLKDSYDFRHGNGHSTEHLFVWALSPEQSKLLVPSLTLKKGYIWKELVEYCKDDHRGPTCMKISDRLIAKGWLQNSTLGQ